MLALLDGVFVLGKGREEGGLVVRAAVVVVVVLRVVRGGVALGVGVGR